jgi:hypothetical protein
MCKLLDAAGESLPSNKWPFWEDVRSKDGASRCHWAGELFGFAITWSGLCIFCTLRRNIAMKTTFLLIAMLGMLCFLSATALAVTVTMTANDPFGISSFNSAGMWSDGLAPSAGKDYSTVGYLLRTSIVAGNYTFAGDTLTVGGGSGGGAFVPGVDNNNAFINKTPNSPIITVNNLILDASTIRDGMGTMDIWTIAGNIYVTSNGGNFNSGCHLNVNSAISGPGPIYIGDNGSGEEARATWINSGLNDYSGNITLMGRTAAHARLNFADDSLMKFSIGASGVNNSISGTGTVNYYGDFYFNLDGAGTGLGDSWAVSSATSQTFGDTFTVIGFTDIGGDLWRKSANGALYEFSESTATLTVIPEPATWIMLVSAAMGIAFYVRRKK